MRSVTSLSQKKAINNTKEAFAFVKWLFTIATAIISVIVFIQLAAAERGYAGAIGGEIFIMPIPPYLMYKFFDLLSKNIKY